MRILVATASRHGSTAEIGVEIGKALRGGVPGAAVDVLPAEQVSSVDEYDAVVLGSGVYMGRWLEAARRLAAAHADQLRARPVWLFSSGPVGDAAPPGGEPVPGGGPAARGGGPATAGGPAVHGGGPAADEPADAVELAAAVGAREHVVFAGRLDRELLKLHERLAVSLVHAPDGDGRDWPAVRAWAGRVAADLRVATKVS